MNLKNKIVVITGSSAGLGKALAVQFLEEGAEVILNSQDKKELTETAKEIGVFRLVGDVTKEKDMQKLADFAAKKFGRVDVWVNNAGISMPYLPIEKIDSKQAHKLMEVNFFGTFYGSRSAIKYFKKQRSGVLVNIISVRSFVPSPLSLIYSTTKWAVRGLTEALRMILKPDNVLVVAVHPAGMKTDLFKKFKPKKYGDYMEPEYVAKKIILNLKRAKPKEEIIVKK